MTERDTYVNVADGDQLNEGFFDDIANYVIEVDTQTDATEYSQSTDTLTLTKTFTFTPTDANTVITRIDLICSLKGDSGAHDAGIGISVSGTNLGEYFYSRFSNDYLFTWSKYATSPAFLCLVRGTTYKVLNFSLPCIFSGDTSYSIKIWLADPTSTDTAYLDEQTLKVFYQDTITEQA